MTSGHASEMSTQEIGDSYKWEPWAIFGIYRFYDFLIFIFKFKEALTFLGVVYKGFLPFMKDAITLFLFAK